MIKIIKLLENKLESSENEINHFQKETEYFQKEMEYYKMMLNEAGKMMHKSVSALTYIAMHYKDAPGLTMIEPNEALKLITDDKSNDTKVMRTILEKFEDKKLIEYIGDRIIEIYKKDNPNEQSIWNSDSSRLTYIIKEILNNSSANDLESCWKVDKKGHKTKKFLIDPLLNKIKKMLIDYQIIMMRNMQKKTIENMTRDLDKTGQDFESDSDIDDDIINSHKLTSKLVKTITKGTLTRKILKYISSDLCFEYKKE